MGRSSDLINTWRNNSGEVLCFENENGFPASKRRIALPHTAFDNLFQPTIWHPEVYAFSIFPHERGKIFLYLYREKEWSIKILNRIKVALLESGHYPGRPTDFRDVRVSLVSHFSIFYKVEEEMIIIVGLWDNRRNPDDLHANLET
jgi:hypothetical protein